MATAEPAATASPPSRRRRRRRRRIVMAAGVLVALWVAAAGFELARGVSAASHGMAAIDGVKGHLTAADATSDAQRSQTTATLRRAQAEFTTARSHLESPLLAPIDILPVLGRQLRSVQALAGAAAVVAHTGADALDQAHAILDVPHQGGPARIAVLTELSGLARRTDATLSHLDTGPGEALVGPVATKHDSFVREVRQVRAELQHAADAAGAVARILQGPQTYLVLMANNAEMRAGSGAFLEAGVLTTSDGEAHLGGVEPTTGLTLAPGQVPVGGQLEANWGWLLPGVDWRNLGFTPQFDVNGALAARMWEARTGQHVDGVLAVDVETLRQVLEVTGPVTLADGTQVGAGDVEQLLMHTQYEGLTYATTGPELQADLARQELLGSLAQRAFDALENEPVDLRALSVAMSTAAEGRHLLLWSQDPATEAAWTATGVAGRLNPDSMLVGLINRGGNKLDQYVTVHVGLALGGPSRTDATLSVQIANHTPAGQSQFIAGPYPGLGTTYGEYIGVLSVNVPGSASRPAADGAATLDALGGEGPTWVIAVPVDVQAGRSQVVLVHFAVRHDTGGATVVPSARLPAVEWDVPGGHHDDGTPFSIPW